MKKWIVLLLTVCLLCSVLAGCGKKITAEEAYKIVQKDLAKTTSAAIESLDIHEGTYEGKACYNIFVTVNGVHLNYAVSQTGQILYSGVGEAHSH